uniref:MDR family oxidoreductase n=1 Tax=Rhodococcus qingshengii TaxID=334542 RepID=UPI001C4E278C|nr:MDR family oxidoreductase [Rhodococcus qingshengii]
MRAVIISDRGAAPSLVEIDEDSLLSGDVELDVLYSSYNFKDGLALADKGVARTWPLIPGIDIVGKVTRSTSSEWSTGDLVVLNGDGLGESRHGGFAPRARVRSASLVRLPPEISPERAAAIGTAGFTAMVAVLKLEDAGIGPDSGEILVTGSAGGVGSIAIALLAKRGYRVTASTGRIDEQGDYLRFLGAARLIDRVQFSERGGSPLETERWAGAIDTIGSSTLANVLAQTTYGGMVVACGLAQGLDLPTTVLPFILRDATLTGANSVDAPVSLRQRVWKALARELDLGKLDTMTTKITLAETIPYAAQILRGQVRGRTVVDVNH